jgi:Kef-type K+ transport system membrane component KefB
MMEINLILSIGIMVVVGFFGGLLARKAKFPRITGYIVIGILLSPSLLAWFGVSPLIPESLIIGKPGNPGLAPITDIALGIIAYLIGGSIKLESLKGLGKSIGWIVCTQALGAWLLVTLLLTFLMPYLPFLPEPTSTFAYFPIALVIGAISCATAPAATMAIIHECKAKGPLTTTLLATVALDDVIAIVAFAIALSVSKGLIGLQVSLGQMATSTLVNIFGSIALGIAFGSALLLLSRLARTRELLLVIIFGWLMLGIGIANLLNGAFPILELSPILALMSAGFVVGNKSKREELFSSVEGIEEVVFAMFFVLAGLHFDLEVIKIAGLIALLIILGRCFGKFVGARAGATISHAPDSVKKYLGFALLPKAGVTLGLVVLAARLFPALGSIMISAVLASVIINELFAPPLTKYAIFKAGEASTTS